MQNITELRSIAQDWYDGDASELRFFWYEGRVRDIWAFRREVMDAVKTCILEDEKPRLKMLHDYAIYLTTRDQQTRDLVVALKNLMELGVPDAEIRDIIDQTMEV